MSKLTHRPVTITAAGKFVSQHHRHNKAPRGGRFAVEAMWQGEVVGVAIVGRPLARSYDPNTTCEVLRCCVIDGAPRNTPSYLYGVARRVWQTWGGKRVITYTLAKEPGDSLRGAGFLLVAALKPRPKGWASAKRKRVNAPIYAEPKCRWEAAA